MIPMKFVTRMCFSFSLLGILGYPEVDPFFSLWNNSQIGHLASFVTIIPISFV